MTASKLFIRELSDLHLEFYYDLYNSNGALAKQEVAQILPPLPTDKKTVLIVAGDLATARAAGRIVTFMELVVNRFKHVIYVLGNHEHYGFDISKSLDTIREALESSSRIDMKKITLAGNNIETVVVGDVTFHCGTLWTDYGRDPDVMKFIAQRYLNDHRAIRKGDGSVFLPEDACEIHVECIQELTGKLEGRDNSKTVVVTHHMPSYQAVDPQYKGDETSLALNGAFTSDLDDFIIKHRPAFWFFGHTHTSFEGKVGDTLLVCNPLGYPQEKNAAKGVFTSAKVYSL